MPPTDQTLLCGIARTAMEIVSDLLRRDQDHAGSVRSASTSSTQLFREETITEQLVSRLVEEYPDHVKLTLFTPPEEAAIGADWYWQIRRGPFALHALVQAKRVRRTTLGGDDQAGVVEIDRDQLFNLRNNRLVFSRKMPGLQSWLVTYARFGAVPPCGAVPCECAHHGCSACPRDLIPSIWAQPVDDIVQKLKFETNSVPVRDIVEESVRLDCVVPCVQPLLLGGQKFGPAIKGIVMSGDVPDFRRMVTTIRRDQELASQLAGAFLISA